MKRETSSLMRWLRIGHFFYKHKIPILPSIINRYIRIVYSCDIPVQTEIGPGVRFVHNGLGVVVNPSAIIGANVRIYQNVSIAGRRNRGTPIIEEDVFIGCNACILGGVRIGRGAEIGAGAVVITDIPEMSIAVGVPAKVVKIKS